MKVATIIIMIKNSGTKDFARQMTLLHGEVYFCSLYEKHFLSEFSQKIILRVAQSVMGHCSPPCARNCFCGRRSRNPQQDKIRKRTHMFTSPAKHSHQLSLSTVSIIFFSQTWCDRVRVCDHINE